MEKPELVPSLQQRPAGEVLQWLRDNGFLPSRPQYRLTSPHGSGRREAAEALRG